MNTSPSNAGKGTSGMFKNIFSFNGRIGRPEYVISYIVSYLGFYILEQIVFAGRGNFIYFGLGILLLYLIIAQTAKRCHDRGVNGWWQLIPFYSLWLLVAEGEPGTNKYGPAPQEDQVLNEVNLSE
jgi:uncharacterized membrane protein YhaH (DUF805 family)